MLDKKPLIIQSDYTLLLEVNTENYTECRDFLSMFAELVKSPEHMHTYRITPISLWNAASTKIPLETIMEGLRKFSRYEIPENVTREIESQYDRFGILQLSRHPLEHDRLILEATDIEIFKEIKHRKEIQKHFLVERADNQVEISLLDRGRIKQLLIEIGFPVQDNVGFTDGKPFPFTLADNTRNGKPFILRDYQQEAADIFHLNGAPGGGHGVIVLPSGSGKTIVGIDVMQRIGQHTLILATNVAAVHQWIEEILDKTNVKREDIGEYTGTLKEIKPITVATYQILVYRKNKESSFPHFSLFYKNPWGLIIYDEVHLLPAPIFRITAEIQARRRLGLTATLIREDGLEKEVFTLIGPKRYDTPWKVLEKKGWIAQAYCHEIRVPMKKSLRLKYIHASKRARFRIASENQLKEMVAEQIMERYQDRSLLVIGQYVGQLERFANRFHLPIITGKTKNDERDEIYEQFRQGRIKQLVVSKVANFSIDLPDASVAIQISGTFGSRQEEAQRLGRILRPKRLSSYFYTLVSEDSNEQDFALKRQMFLVEQGYQYSIEKWTAEELGVELDDQAEEYEDY
jgi:DNA excision repair protein ERCC-3